MIARERTNDTHRSPPLYQATQHGCIQAQPLPVASHGSCNRHRPIATAQTFTNFPLQGDARILHITDVHGQLKPVYFREPNVNLGVGDAYGRPPHVVGKGLLKAMGMPEDETSLEAYAYTYLNFEEPTLKNTVVWAALPT